MPCEQKRTTHHGRQDIHFASRLTMRIRTRRSTGVAYLPLLRKSSRFTIQATRNRVSSLPRTCQATRRALPCSAGEPNSKQWGCISEQGSKYFCDSHIFFLKNRWEEKALKPRSTTGYFLERRAVLSLYVHTFSVIICTYIFWHYMYIHFL